MEGTLDTVAAGFLIAAPSLQDPNFDHTVVLICVHNDQGAMGLVINRAAPLTTRDLMVQLGIDCSVNHSHAVLIGGPVSLESGVLLYRPRAGSEPQDDELVISDDLRLCPSQDLLKATAEGRGPDKYHVLLGHAGWAPGQLEQEISQGAWIPGRLQLDIIFSTPIEKRWEGALQAEGLSAAMVSTFRPQS